MTPEQLLERIRNYETAPWESRLTMTDTQILTLLRAHAAALEELARIKAPADGEIALVLHTLRNMGRPLTGPEQMILRVIESLAAKVAQKDKALTDTQRINDKLLERMQQRAERAEAELAKLKAHAEAMAFVVEAAERKLGNESYTLAAYRAAYPKE